MVRTGIKGVLIPSDEQWIYDWFGIEGTSPAKIRKALDDAKGDEVIVEVNSPGGYVTVGSEIYTLLSQYPGKVTIDIVGQAASAASMAAMARHNRISPTASIMIHNVSLSGVSGDYHEMDRASETLQALTRSVANAYTIKSGKARQDVLDLMDKETTMDADTAIAEGFIDEMIPSANGNTAALATNSKSFMIPSEMIEKMKATMESPEEALNKAKAEFELLKLEVVQ